MDRTPLDQEQTRTEPSGLEGPDVVAMCSFCRKVHDRENSSCEEGVWVDFHVYLGRHRLRPVDVTVSQTYCHDCSRFYHQLTTYGGSA